MTNRLSSGSGGERAVGVGQGEEFIDQLGPFLEPATLDEVDVHRLQSDHELACAVVGPVREEHHVLEAGYTVPEGVGEQRQLSSTLPGDVDLTRGCRRGPSVVVAEPLACAQTGGTFRQRTCIQLPDQGHLR